jgi:hypothetical protein
MKPVAATFVALLVAAAVCGAEDPPAFRFERSAIPAAKGANRLDLDAPLLSGAAPLRYRREAGAEPAFEGGLEDLRFFDAGGRELAYLLIAPRPVSAAWRGGRILPITATKTQSGFEVDLGGTYRVDRLSLEGIAPPYLKRVRLEGGGDRSRWTLLVAEGTLFDLPEEKLARTWFEFPPGEFRYFRVLWDDRSSGKVDLPRSASARLAGSAPTPPAARLDAVFERRPSEPGRSRFRVRLPGSRLPVAALEFTVAASHLFRPVAVFEPRLSGGEVVPTPLGSGTLRRAERGDLVASDLAVAIGFPEGPDLDVVVEDGSNPPLELTGVRARLAPLPWIYFESADGAPVTARFGAAGAKAPRYDLEAVRERAEAAAAAPARWGERRDLAPVPATTAAPMLPAGAPIDASKFRHARPVPSAAPGLNALRLDAAVLAGSGLGDLRLSDRDGRQVPYLLEKQDEPLAVELAAPERLPAKGGSPSRSHYRILLPYAGLPSCRLAMTTPLRVFERRVALFRRRPAQAGSEAESIEIAESDWRHADPESPAPSLVLALPPPEAAELMLVVDEGDNSPLPLDRPRLLLPSYRLRFFGDPGESLTLLYGQPGLPSPRYDLALLSARLVGVAAHELSLPPETAPPPPTGASRETRVFWGILVAAVAAFLLLIVRLVRKEQPAA